MTYPRKYKFSSFQAAKKRIENAQPPLGEEVRQDADR